ncbi:hypothetical protein ACFLSJ_08950 [Verrucomicrobiota bacterium]
MNALSIGTQRQLFIDDRLMEQHEGVVLTPNPPDKAGLVELQTPASGHVCVVEYQGRFFMYYRDTQDFAGMNVALSEDGITWTNPEPPLVLPGVGAGSVFIDPHATDERPFKALLDINCASRWGMDPAMTGRAVPAGRTQAAALGGMFLFRSRDGIEWEIVPQMALPFLCDTHNQVFHDTRLDRYVAYLRGFPEQESMPHRYKRVVVRTETPDLMAMPWPHTPNPLNVPDPRHKYPYIGDEMEIVMAADEHDPPRTDLYNPCMHLYPYAADAYLAFPSMYRNFDNTPSYGRDLRGLGSNSGLFEVHLAVSRDGHTFYRYRTPYVRCGMIRDRKGYDGEPDCGLIMMGIGMVRAGDKLYQYYHGAGRIHGGRSVAEDSMFPTGGVFRVVQRLDGFVSADTDHSGGELTTPVIQFEGNGLYLNADCGGLGEIQVEIRDPDGSALPGYALDEAVSIDRNGTAQEIWWRNGPDVSALAGRPIRLHFKMRSSKLYAFQFVARSQPMS